jgi:hypothetical protein
MDDRSATDGRARKEGGSCNVDHAAPVEGDDPAVARERP